MMEENLPPFKRDRYVYIDHSRKQYLSIYWDLPISVTCYCINQLTIFWITGEDIRNREQITFNLTLVLSESNGSTRTKTTKASDHVFWIKMERALVPHLIWTKTYWQDFMNTMGHLSIKTITNPLLVLHSNNLSSHLQRHTWLLLSDHHQPATVQNIWWYILIR